MDPIRRTTGPHKPQDIAGAAPSAPPSQPFAAGAAAPIAGAARPEFTRIAARISQGIARKQSRDDIMRDVVSTETRERFGSLATPQMAESVAESFRSDPALSALVAKLFAAAASA